jgi:CheY-like chemotaxis protein
VIGPPGAKLSPEEDLKAASPAAEEISVTVLLSLLLAALVLGTAAWLLDRRRRAPLFGPAPVTPARPSVRPPALERPRAAAPPRPRPPVAPADAPPTPAPAARPAPADPPPCPAAATEAAEDASALGSVLLVDDDESVRRSSARLLRRAGYAVTEARSADEALALYREDGLGADVVLSDVVMPGMNGIDFSDQVRETWPQAEVVLFSAFTPAALSRHKLHDGSGLRVLQKPLEPDALLAAIAAAVDAARARR